MVSSVPLDRREQFSTAELPSVDGGALHNVEITGTRGAGENPREIDCHLFTQEMSIDKT
jgi:hypothetical protein